jgi:hypothetical protein
VYLRFCQLKAIKRYLLAIDSLGKDMCARLADDATTRMEGHACHARSEGHACHAR